MNPSRPDLQSGIVDPPLVSIAMATYNGERFLAQQLDSLLLQTYPNLEIVICDDRSSDQTLAILKELSAKDSRIKLQENPENLGYMKNFEKAASLCQGDFIAFCDQDDIWHPEKISILMDAMGGKHLAYCDTTLIDAEGQQFKASRYTHLRQLEHARPEEFMALTHKNILGCTMLVTRALLESALPFPPRGYRGHDNWLMSIARALESYVFVDRPLVNYRIHGNNVSEGTVPTTFLQRVKHRAKADNNQLYKLLRRCAWSVTDRKIERFKATHPFWQDLNRQNKKQRQTMGEMAL